LSAASPILAEVAALVCETLSLPREITVRADQLLVDDLSFTSMDLLDLLFRIEDRFGIAITEGTIGRLARGDLAEATFAHDGLLSEAGRTRLMELLSDTPRALFPERVAVSGLPRYCTVGAVARVVERLLVEKKGDECSS
jgi:acyl carrier protein